MKKSPDPNCEQCGGEGVVNVDDTQEKSGYWYDCSCTEISED